MATLISIPFKVLEIPNINFVKPSWMKPPSPMEMLSLISLAYFLIIAGIVYDFMTESPCFGMTTDSYGRSRMVAVIPKRANIQHVVDRLARSSLFSLLGIGFLTLDLKYNPTNVYKNMFISVVFVCILFSFFTTWLFNRIMYPDCGCVRC